MPLLLEPVEELRSPPPGRARSRPAGSGAAVRRSRNASWASRRTSPPGASRSRLQTHGMTRKRSCRWKWASMSIWGSRWTYSGLSEPRTGPRPSSPGRGAKTRSPPPSMMNCSKSSANSLSRRRMPASYQPTMNGRSRYLFSPFISSFRTPPPAVVPGSATRPRGIRLSRSAVTSTTSRPTRFAISAAVSGVARQLAGQPDLLGREGLLHQLDLHARRRAGEAMRERLQRSRQPFVDVFVAASRVRLRLRPKASSMMACRCSTRSSDGVL